ncbi:hypothetical protein ACS0TY_011487 [Phlomoides rotata]
MVLWKIWSLRNDKLWNGSCSTSYQGVITATSFLQEWACRVVHSPLAKVRECRAWHRPTHGFPKVNIDAAFFEETSSMGFGMVIRDECGNFVAARSSIMDGCKDVIVGEIMGFLESHSWVKSLQL